MVTPQVNRLPKEANDQEQVMDLFGNVFEFDTETKGWYERGVVRSFDIVNEEVSGLVSSEIFTRLDVIRRLIEQGVSFKRFKIKTDRGFPYFYYFFSSDDLIRFYVERDGITNLRIEVDKARLYYRLLRTTCAGQKGLNGEKGDNGKDGEPAPNEKFKTPKVSGSALEVLTSVPTPIDTDISLRFFKTVRSTRPAAEFLIPLGTGEVVVNVIDKSISVVSHEFDFATGTLSGSVTFSGDVGNLVDWRFKARQRGARGQKGRDGTRFVEILSEVIDDPSIRATEALITLRKSPINDNIFFTKKGLFDEVCVSSLRVPSSILPIGDVTEAKWVSVAITTAACKDIGAFQFARPDFEPPTLDMPNWEPASCCYDRIHYDKFKFDWFAQADPQLPFTIVTDPRPPEQCCQADFFWCPNVGDNPCGVQGQVEPPERIAGPPEQELPAYPYPYHNE
jgi:hypothetical protein